MKHYQAILFDMDGTLLPMDTEAFLKLYIKALAGTLAPLGIAPDQLLAPFWAATKAMMTNDGSCLNADAFWSVFSQMTGVPRETVEPVCDAFYTGAFLSCRAATGENPLAAQAIRLAHEKAEKVVLATNPLFPMAAQKTRMSWVNLSPADFDLVTHYTSDRFCKPNPAYYLSICERMGVDPGHCLMIGNDDREDMHAAAAAGMDCYLVTDCRLPLADTPWKGAMGSFADMVEMLQTL